MCKGSFGESVDSSNGPFFISSGQLGLTDPKALTRGSAHGTMGSE